MSVQLHFNKVKEKITFDVLSIFSFLVVGMGNAANYCMKQRVSAISSKGNALKFTHLKCKRIQCPHCWGQWVMERVLELSIKVECYAKVIGKRPSMVVVSVPPDSVKKWTWKDYTGFFRKGYNRLFGLNVLGGIRIFHPFRVKKDVQKLMRGVGIKDGGFWANIRKNFFKYSSWYDYVDLSPHMHCLVFPGFIKQHDRKDLLVRKYMSLRTTKDVVVHMRYLLNHSGLLRNSECEPATVFGSLYKFKPHEHLTYEEYKAIENRVRGVMGMPAEADGCVKDEEKDVKDKYGWIPISWFGMYNAEKAKWVDDFVCSILNKDHRLFVYNIIDDYNRKRTETGLKAYERNVFLEELDSCPPGFEFVLSDTKKKKDKEGADFPLINNQDPF
jgi:hypothetical protein